MQIQAISAEDYISKLPDDRKEPVSRLRDIVLKNIPDGFEETVGYGAFGYVVPKSIYPNGYHCDPAQPLPFLGIASQKNFIAIYHMGIYADPVLMKWFVEEYPKHSSTKLDMGKSCIRFKNIKNIPYELIAELVAAMSVDEWIRIYETQFKAARKK